MKEKNKELKPNEESLTITEVIPEPKEITISIPIDVLQAPAQMISVQK